MAVEEGHPSTLDLQRAELIVERVLGLRDRLAKPLGVVHVAVDEMRRQSVQQRHDLRADVAAMNDQADM